MLRTARYSQLGVTRTPAGGALLHVTQASMRADRLSPRFPSQTRAQMSAARNDGRGGQRHAPAGAALLRFYAVLPSATPRAGTGEDWMIEVVVSP